MLVSKHIYRKWHFNNVFSVYNSGLAKKNKNKKKAAGNDQISQDSGNKVQLHIL